MGFIKQLITGGHHFVGIVRIKKTNYRWIPHIHIYIYIYIVLKRMEKGFQDAGCYNVVDCI